MTIDSILDFDGTQWVITDDGIELARYDEAEIRLSLSWKARVFGSEAERASSESAIGEGRGPSIEEILTRMGAAIDEPLAVDPALGREALSSAALRDQLFEKFFPYRSD